MHYLSTIKRRNKTMNATCPECDAAISLPADTVAGEILVCPDCAAELEVTAVDPPTLALAPEVGEDWGE
jgi:alpha-aminoadipate carrier protein LysW